MIASSANAFYRFLNQFGFTDPVHAALVHMPIGLVVGAFLFGWTASLMGRKELAVTAYHCTILAFLFWFPVVLFGLMDWQHFYQGAWLMPIKIKLILAGILLIILATSILLGRKGESAPKGLLLAVSTLAVITVTLLGWFGARLIYDGKVKEAPVTYDAGEKIFAAHCRSCHPDGGNVIDPNAPILGSSPLKSPEAFISLIRKPKKPMPAFSPARLSDEDARQLYLYITNVLAKSDKQGSKR
jgi:mono/diheme cytochrome c family protein